MMIISYKTKFNSLKDLVNFIYDNVDNHAVLTRENNNLKLKIGVNTKNIFSRNVKFSRSEFCKCMISKNVSDILKEVNSKIDDYSLNEDPVEFISVEVKYENYPY